jgi:hypothetical protein
MIEDKLFIGSIIVLVISFVSLMITATMSDPTESTEIIMYISLGTIICSGFVAYFTFHYDNQPVIP